MAIATGQKILASEVLAAIAARALITSGSYTGNATANRAIPHGLAAVPEIVLMSFLNSGTLYSIFKGRTVIASELGASDPVTTPDATNFYVGNATEYNKSANVDTVSYFWVAIGF